MIGGSRVFDRRFRSGFRTRSPASERFQFGAVPRQQREEKTRDEKRAEQRRGEERRRDREEEEEEEEEEGGGGKRARGFLLWDEWGGMGKFWREEQGKEGIRCTSGGKGRFLAAPRLDDSALLRGSY